MTQAIVCGACGFGSPAAFRFCGQCGRPLSGALPARPVEAAAREALAAQRERRQLTILFCDLAGSTALSARMDAEDFGELIAAYFDLCNTTFKRYRAYVDREEGDSLRVYFGYPAARDDDALRAVYAALEIVTAVALLGTRLGCPLGVHIGIHTGEVIAGEPETDERPGPRIIGQAPNIAKRLQELAPPDCLYVSATTIRMVERRFEAESLGRMNLKGLPRPVEVFRVIGQRGSASTIEQFDARVLAPLVSRDEELALLEQQWQLACKGQGQVMLVKGEPGIGKSRLLHAFLSRRDRANCRVLTTQCQEQFANSALYPLIDLLQRDLGLERERSTDEQASTLLAAVASGRMPTPDALPLVGNLLALPVAAPMAEDSARAQRERTLDWLVQWVLGTDAGMPVTLAIEDLHWADASTLDFLGLLREQARSRCIFILLTYRPEFVPPWPLVRPNLSELALCRIGLSQARGMAQNIAGATPLPDAILQRIAARSDGVPLFVEELTKMLLEARGSGEWQSYPSQPDTADVSIPETLRGSLTARLDYLSVAKSIAQLASVLGREFSYTLIHLVSEMDHDRLQEALAELVEAELLFQRGLPPNATFVFKHVLVQEAAYLSLLKARRAAYHMRTAGVLVDRFEDLVDRHPELAAHHYAAAGKPEQACDFWHRAGQRALDASADVEAAAHLRLALQQLELLPDREKQVPREVKCLITLGSALTATCGYAATEVEEVFARAHTLCQSLGDVAQLYSALMGLHGFYQVRGSLQPAVALGEKLIAIAEGRDDRLWRAQSHRCLGWSLFCNGQLTAGAEHLYIALALFDRLQAREHVRTQGAHPWVVGFVNTALLEWFAGNEDRAIERSRQGLELAREIQVPLPLAYALCMSAKVHCLRHDPESALTLAAEAIELAVKHGMPYWASWGSILQGWALVHLGQQAPGLAAMHAGLAGYRATGAKLFESSSLALLAEGYATAGDLGRALQTVELALDNPLVPDGYFYTPELHRLHGELLHAAGADILLARLATRKAVELARVQGAASVEKRATQQLGLLDATVRSG
ncbi:AAA family ATPase [Variovorax guangxiensis]|uniref:AAA family ATPase n=1 Tax=Variovorax guangxiensis TaxID=1775474 RepID=UPI00285F52DC|nr:adenylate/guanylate cyclase domain-containing protein [Variovorax guangxiensis]MDR6859865.1 class 3 adenylate cyclase/predicted ATPase [Variovorax guangxiensis]